MKKKIAGWVVGIIGLCFVGLTAFSAVMITKDIIRGGLVFSAIGFLATLAGVMRLFVWGVDTLVEEKKPLTPSARVEAAIASE